MTAQSLLWVITPPAGRPSWLFGTMHIRDERAHQMAQNLYPLIQAADVFMGEMDLTQPDVAIESPWYDVTKFLKPEAFEKLRQQLLKSFRIDINKLNHLHPLMIMSAISHSVLQTEHLISLDEHLWNYAKEHGKEVIGLESYEEQYQILHSIEAGPLYKQLRNIGRNPSGVRKHTSRGLNLYMMGKIHELYILSRSSMHDLRKKIIYKRNARMSEVITGLDVTHQYFITVGAGHLSGVTGIISSLRKKGWSVKPVKRINPPLQQE